MPTNEEIEKLKQILKEKFESYEAYEFDTDWEGLATYIHRLLRIERLRGARDELYSWSGLAEYNAVLERLKELNRQLEEAEREKDN